MPGLQKPAHTTTPKGSFSLRDLLVMALLAALGLATKPLLNPLSRLLLGAFLIPGGVIFGGLYMMWLTLSRGIVGKTGSATLTAFIQGMVAFALGLSPVYGLLSALVFLLPGISVDLIFLIPGETRSAHLSRFLLSSMAANIIGIATVALLRGFVHHTLMVIIVIGALSGGAGGLVAFLIWEKISLRASHQPSGPIES